MKAQILAYLKGLPVVVYVIVGTVAAASGWLLLNNAHQRALGAERILTAQAVAAGKLAAHRADSLAKVYRVDTLRLTKLKLKTDTMTQTVEQWKHDTVQVVKYVVQADSTIKACTQALLTCEARVGAERQRTEAAQAEAKQLRAQMPGRLTPWKDRALGLAVGLVAGYVAKR